MLYDPKWEVETKPDIYALPTLIAWLEKMPAEEEYFHACPVDAQSVHGRLDIDGSGS